MLAELEQGSGAAAAAMTAAGGELDGLALGEWIHGGDVRKALGEPAPYQSEGVEDALLLLVDRSRRRNVPPTLVRLPDREVRLGAGAATAPPPAELDTDVPTLIQLSTGRRPDPTRFRLTGADPGQYLIFD